MSSAERTDEPTTTYEQAREELVATVSKLEAGGTALFRLLQTHDFLIAFQLRLIAGHLVAEQLVDQTDRLPALGRHAVLAGLELIELLQHGHGDGDLVFLEIQQGVGIVYQDVRVEDVERGLGGARSAVVIHTDHLLLGSEAKRISAPPQSDRRAIG